MDKIIDEIIKKLTECGHAEFAKDGLKIKAKCDNGCISIKTSYTNQEDNKNHKADKLVNKFESYIDSLSDDFFIEIAEYIGNETLHEIQEHLDSKDLDRVRTGITMFMGVAKDLAGSKVSMIDKDIKEIEETLDSLIEARDSYIHVLKKTF